MERNRNHPCISELMNFKLCYRISVYFVRDNINFPEEMREKTCAFIRKELTEERSNLPIKRTNKEKYLEKLLKIGSHYLGAYFFFEKVYFHSLKLFRFIYFLILLIYSPTFSVSFSLTFLYLCLKGQNLKKMELKFNHQSSY